MRTGQNQKKKTKWRWLSWGFLVQRHDQWCRNGYPSSFIDHGALKVEAAHNGVGQKGFNLSQRVRFCSIGGGRNWLCVAFARRVTIPGSVIMSRCKNVGPSSCHSGRHGGRIFSNL